MKASQARVRGLDYLPARHSCQGPLSDLHVTGHSLFEGLVLRSRFARPPSRDELECVSFVERLHVLDVHVLQRHHLLCLDIVRRCSEGGA